MGERSLALTLVVAAVAELAACGGDSRSSVAELTKATSETDRKDASDDPVDAAHPVTSAPNQARPDDLKLWHPVKVGRQFFLGDSAKTADGTATFTIAGGAQLDMDPHTTLRFAGTASRLELAVTTGAVDFTGTGSYGIAIGDSRVSGMDVKMSKSKLRITAGPDGAAKKIELVVGEAQVTTLDGTTVALVPGKQEDIAELIVTNVQIARIRDAGADNAPVDAPQDAGPLADFAMIEVAGRNAKILQPDGKWKPLATGAGQIEKGTKLQIGNGTTVRIVALDTTVQLGAGSHATLGEDLVVMIETGDIQATVPPERTGTVKLPDGSLVLTGSKDSSAEAKVNVNAKESKINMLRGIARLLGAAGTTLDLSAGESASLAKAGTIRVIVAIPQYFDLRIPVGETLKIHDPKGATAVQFAFGDKCSGQGGFIELDRDSRYRTPAISTGKETANMMVTPGGYYYRLRCNTAAGNSAPVIGGIVEVLRDAGNRKVASKPPNNPIVANGKPWRITYQGIMPNLVLTTPDDAAYKLHFASGGKDEVYEGSGTITVPSKSLHEGDYTFWLEKNGVRDAKVSTLNLAFENTAPLVFIEKPVNAQPWPDTGIPVSGAVLPGWTAAVEGVPVPINAQRVFSATAPHPVGKALAIRMTHPRFGIHYYLRREN